MFDRNTSDSFNPVFLKCMRMGMRTMILPGICLILALIQLIFWYGLKNENFFLNFNIKERFSLYLFICMVVFASSGVGGGCHELKLEKQSEGLDVSRGTRLSAFRIMKGYAISNLVHVALPAIVSIPLIIYMKVMCDDLSVAMTLIPFVSATFFCCAYSMAGTAILHLGACGRKGSPPVLFYAPLVILFFISIPVFYSLFFDRTSQNELVYIGGWVTVLSVCIWLIACAFEYGAQLMPTQDRTRAGRIALLLSFVAIVPVSALISAYTFVFWVDELKKETVIWGIIIFVFMTVISVFEPFGMSRREKREMKSGFINSCISFLASGNVFSTSLISLIMISVLAGISVWTGELMFLNSVTGISSIFMYASFIIFCRSMFNWTPVKSCMVVAIAFVVFSMSGVRFFFFKRLYDYISTEICLAFLGSYLSIAVLCLMASWLKCRKRNLL